MNTKQVTAIFFAVVLASNGRVLALEKKHSIHFDSRYECGGLPENDGWDVVNTPKSATTSNGWLHVVGDTNNIITFDYRNESWSVDTNDDYTVEIRYMTPLVGNWHMYIHDDHPFSHITPGFGESGTGYAGIVVTNGPETVYTFRFASWMQGPNRYFQSWRNGIALHAQTNSFMYEGFWQTLGFQGNGECDAKIDYLRMDHSGAYTPDIPRLTIGNPLEIGWDSNTGVIYQVQTTTNLVTGTWTDFGATVVGNGTTNYISDAVLSTAAKFYRVIETTP